jgi:hypothetical protein
MTRSGIPGTIPLQNLLTMFRSSTTESEWASGTMDKRVIHRQGGQTPVRPKLSPPATARSLFRRAVRLPLRRLAGPVFRQMLGHPARAVDVGAAAGDPAAFPWGPETHAVGRTIERLPKVGFCAGRADSGNLSRTRNTVGHGHRMYTCVSPAGHLVLCGIGFRHTTRCT